MMNKTSLTLMAAIAGLASSSFGAITLVPDQAYSGLITSDPELNSPAQRGIAADRKLRQTFVLATGLDVGQIELSIALSGADGGLVVSFYEVSDPMAGSWSPGTLIKTLTLATSVDLPSSSATLGINLTDADVFNLPAGNYGVEISNADGTTTIGNVRHDNAAGVDTYVEGRFYIESGNPSNSSYRDFGVSLSAASSVPEPTSALLGALGVIGLLRRRR